MQMVALDTLEDGTPEKALWTWLWAWRRCNYFDMARNSCRDWKQSGHAQGHAPNYLKNTFGRMVLLDAKVWVENLRGYETDDRVDTVGPITDADKQKDIAVVLKLRPPNWRDRKKRKDKGKGMPALDINGIALRVHKNSDGVWRVHPISASRTFNPPRDIVEEFTNASRS
jgi:hypothetical protein